MIVETKDHLTSAWKAAVPYERWKGFRQRFSGIEAFESLDKFKIAQLAELYASLEDHERQAIGRLLKRGQKTELEVFVRTHGANPLFDPQQELDVNVGVAKADVVSLSEPPSPEAHAAILNGDVVHVLFQAGEATRFAKGPLYQLSLGDLAQQHPELPNVADLLKSIRELSAQRPKHVADFLSAGQLGPKQPVMIRAALRKIIDAEIAAGRLLAVDALKTYERALRKQKILFFVSRHHGVAEIHDTALRKKFDFYGFDPANLVTVEQELIPGISVDEDGEPSLLDRPETQDAAGHMYALIQAARTGAFITYSESKNRQQPADRDAFTYLAERGGKILSVVRINDMDRHTTEIINAKALTYALKLFARGYVNAIEGVANPDGQKGGTGTTFGQPDVHVLTETHENSFPALSRAFDVAMNDYLGKNAGHHPAYNAMRQLADLKATRDVIQSVGGRIVFVPRNKTVGEESLWYLGVDMPMGDLSLLTDRYKSRMFQFSDGAGRELLIHDMKKPEQLSLGLLAIQRQLQDNHILAAAEEVLTKHLVTFSPPHAGPELYGAPAPEFN